MFDERQDCLSIVWATHCAPGWTIDSRLGRPVRSSILHSACLSPQTLTRLYHRRYIRRFVFSPSCVIMMQPLFWLYALVMTGGLHSIRVPIEDNVYWPSSVHDIRHIKFVDASSSDSACSIIFSADLIQLASAAVAAGQSDDPTQVVEINREAVSLRAIMRMEIVISWRARPFRSIFLVLFSCVDTRIPLPTPADLRQIGTWVLRCPNLQIPEIIPTTHPIIGTRGTDFRGGNKRAVCRKLVNLIVQLLTHRIRDCVDGRSVEKIPSRPPSQQDAADEIVHGQDGRAPQIVSWVSSRHKTNSEDILPGSLIDIVDRVDLTHPLALIKEGAGVKARARFGHHYRACITWESGHREYWQSLELAELHIAQLV